VGQGNEQDEGAGLRVSLQRLRKFPIVELIQDYDPGKLKCETCGSSKVERLEVNGRTRPGEDLGGEKHAAARAKLSDKALSECEWLGSRRNHGYSRWHVSCLPTSAGALGRGDRMSTSFENVWSVVLAGGEGERTRAFITSWLGYHKPKQYCTFTGTRSLFQHTVDRADALVSPERPSGRNRR
jgi:hypothetical protein